MDLVTCGHSDEKKRQDNCDSDTVNLHAATLLECLTLTIHHMFVCSVDKGKFVAGPSAHVRECVSVSEAGK